VLISPAGKFFRGIEKRLTLGMKIPLENVLEVIGNPLRNF
jgi:hypothetical protein